MTNESDLKGRSFEFACLQALDRAISLHRKTSVKKDHTYMLREEAWNKLSQTEKATCDLAASIIVPEIFDREPLILEKTEDILEISFLTDGCGEEGDVRDILLKRQNIKWEIGFSVKHNHFAVKHSRLSSKLDFCNVWFKNLDTECSQEYWTEVNPIFEYLTDLRSKKIKWSEVPNKSEKVYIPILNAFVKEVKRQYAKYGSALPRTLVEYLVGKFDFYKVVSVESKRITEVIPYNLHGTLNKPAPNQKPKKILSIPSLPTRIVDISIKPNSDTTVELYLDAGWSFSFRIHSASTLVESSLKFDIQSLGIPTTIVSINCLWR